MNPNPQQSHPNHPQYDTHNSQTAAGDSLRPAKPNPNPRLLILILKSIIMLLVISFFFLFLGIAALAVLHLFLLRRPAPSRGRSISREDLERYLPGFGCTEGGAGEDCAVCLEVFREGDACRRLPGCRHVFHARCVDRWLVKVPNCPICRTRVRVEASDTGLGRGDDVYKVLY